MDFNVDEFCLYKKVRSIRVDTHNDNILMRKVLDRLGFSLCGTIYLENGDPRIAYERVSV